jgi:alpha-D-xyloside xylohydrolase
LDQPYSITVYPGSDATFLLYEDDGLSFNYRKGEWTGIQMDWSERGRVLSLRLADGSRMLLSSRKEFEIKLATTGTLRKIVFEGKRVEVKL